MVPSRPLRLAAVLLVMFGQGEASHRSLTPTVLLRPTPSVLSDSRTCDRRARLRISPHAPQVAFVDPGAAVSAVGNFARQSPFLMAFLTCGVKGFAADFLAQSSASSASAAVADAVDEHARRNQQQRTSSELAMSGGTGAAAAALPPPMTYDVRRGLAFLLYGGLIQGMTLEFIFNNVFTSMFGSRAIPKLVVNQLILAPFFTLPMAYLVKAVVFQKSLPCALKEYGEDVTEKGLVFSFWKLWTPINFLLFSVVPSHLRISFNAVVSFLWTIILSRISSSKHHVQEE